MNRQIREVLRAVAAGEIGPAIVARARAVLEAKPRPRRPPSEATKERSRKRAALRRARSENREACKIREGGRCAVWATGLCRGGLHLDHFFGRGKVPASVELEWMLCEHHDHQKTTNQPSRLYWLRLFRIHAASHSYADALARTDRAIALEQGQHPEARRAG